MKQNEKSMYGILLTHGCGIRFHSLKCTNTFCYNEKAKELETGNQLMSRETTTHTVIFTISTII